MKSQCEWDQQQWPEAISIMAGSAQATITESHRWTGRLQPHSFLAVLGAGNARTGTDGLRGGPLLLACRRPHVPREPWRAGWILNFTSHTISP